MQNHGILAQDATIFGENLLVSNCGERLLALHGGYYRFEHCTFANYFSSSISSRKASVLLNNYAHFEKEILLHPLIWANFTSCIIYGTSQDELELDLKPETTANYNFSYCNIRTLISVNSRFQNCRINDNPYFKNPSHINGDFDIAPHPIQSSGVIGKGRTGTSVSRDLRNHPRPHSPTIGAYEFRE
jgi:hypothetical protein